MIYMYHIFFIHSSVSGHLGCFHAMATVNRAAVNSGVHIFTTSSLSIPLLVDIRLPPCLAYCKQCCREHWGVCILSDHVFLWIYAQGCDCRVIW